MAQVADCLEEAIAGRIRLGDEIHGSSRSPKGEYLVSVPGLTAAGAAMYLAVKGAGLTGVLLAKRLGCNEKAIWIMLDLRHKSKMDTIKTVLESWGFD